MDSNKILTGTGVSPGKAMGTVRVIKEAGDLAGFREGDILVTTITDPSMTPIMSKAGGIICEIGGIMSHPSIVAREMGIPCIVAVENATTILKEGMLVELDGEKGKIHWGAGKNNAEGTYPYETENKELSWTSEFMSSLNKALGDMDVVTFHPFSWFQIHPLYSKEWVNHLSSIVNRKDELNKNAKELSDLFTGPSSIRGQLYFTLLDFKCAKTQKKERIRIANFLYELIKETSLEDIFAENKNIRHSKDAISEILKSIQFNGGNKQIATELGKLYSAGIHLVNSLYSDLYTDHGVEVYGPYDLKQMYKPGHVLVIKHLTNLNPTELWSANGNDICNDIKIYSIYKDITLYSSFVGCHFSYTGSPIDNLVSWAVEIDKRFVNHPEDLQKIREKLESQAFQHNSIVKGYCLEQMKTTSLKQRYYVFRDLCGYLGIDWKPSEDLLEQIKKGTLIDKDYWDVGTDKNSYWKKILNPAVDFYPGESRRALQK